MTDLEKFNVEYDFFLDNIEGLTVSYEDTLEYIEKLQEQLSVITNGEARANFLFLIGMSGLNFMMDKCGNFAEIGNEKINHILDLGRKAIKDACELSPSQELEFMDVLYMTLDIDDDELCSKTMHTCPNPYDIETNLSSSDFLAMLANFVAKICCVKDWVDFAE